MLMFGNLSNADVWQIFPVMLTSRQDLDNNGNYWNRLEIWCRGLTAKYQVLESSCNSAGAIEPWSHPHPRMFGTESPHLTLTPGCLGDLWPPLAPGGPSQDQD